MTRRRRLNPPVAGDAAREAVVARTRAVHDGVAAVMAANGWDMERPAFFWRAEDGTWRVFMGDTPRGHRFIRKAMGAQ